jgi:hypothetical protein
VGSGIRLSAALATVFALVALPAAAQQAPSSNPRLVLPGSSDSDWPPDGTPPSSGSEPSAWTGSEPPIDCGRDLPCRVRLRGVLGRNGAIAIEGTAFTW